MNICKSECSSRQIKKLLIPIEKWMKKENSNINKLSSSSKTFWWKFYIIASGTQEVVIIVSEALCIVDFTTHNGLVGNQYENETSNIIITQLTLRKHLFYIHGIAMSMPPPLIFCYSSIYMLTTFMKHFNCKIIE